MDKITTTLAKIRAASPCADGYKTLVTSLGGCKSYGMDTPIAFRQIYDSNGYYDTLWCLRTVDEKHLPLWRHFAVDCADQVRHLMTDRRSTDALDVARRYANENATDKELYAARTAARAAARAARAPWAAAWAAEAAAARDAAAGAAEAAARDAARDAARAAQMQLLFEYCRTGRRVMNPDRFLSVKETA